MSSLFFSGQLRLTPIICQSRQELNQSPQASGSIFLLVYLSKWFLQNLVRKKTVKRIFPRRLQSKINVFLICRPLFAIEINILCYHLYTFICSRCHVWYYFLKQRQDSIFVEVCINKQPLSPPNLKVPRHINLWCSTTEVNG